MSYNAGPISDTIQQAYDVQPMLDYCWASVVDGGATLNQYWLNVSRFLRKRSSQVQHIYVTGQHIMFFIDSFFYR